MTADPRWSILPAYLVRTAGFSFDRLAVLRCARAAAAAVALDLAADARRQAGQAFDEALAQERFAEHPAFDDPAVRKAFSRQVKQARAFAKQLADAAPPAEALREVARVVPRIAPRVDALDQAHAGWQAASREFATIFAEDFERARAAIRRLYQDDERLQEAVFLESPEAFERIRQLIATAGPRNVRARQRERLAVMYAQRFCAKNDTNSFCGPHGVAYMTDEADRARLELVTEDARRQTYFSQWAAQQLLDAAVRRAGDAAPVTLQLHPTARVGAGAVAWCLMDHDATTAFRRRYARSALAEGAEALVRALARPHTPAQLTALGAAL
ncbi:MAG TPA: lantibiotic dehydratase, partial [Kofleriaceae bacterium]